MNESGVPFFLQNPEVLFDNLFEIIPTTSMSKNEKLNAMARLVIIITIVLYFMKYKYWLYFLLIGFAVILIIKYSKVTVNDDGVTDSLSLKEGFTMTPTYTSTDFNQTTVAPTFAEEWAVVPPTYDLITNEAPPLENTRFQEYMRPQSYPYGQYMTSTNTLPSDEYYLRMCNGGVRQAREYANSFTLRNDLAYRDNMTKLYKKSLARRFKHNCADTFSPFNSY